jgi:uncharacterized protein YbjT (DUF2867 family)
MVKGKTACVVGATGYLGFAVVEELRRRNVAVVAVARNSSSEKVEQLRMIGADVTFVDASSGDQESYVDALASADVAISCLTVSFDRRMKIDKSNDFWAIDRDANIRFGRQALQVGVQHIILVATFEGPESRYVSEFTGAKEEAVDCLQHDCERSAGRTVFTVIRPTAYFKDLTDRAFEGVLNYSRHTVIGRGSCQINPVSKEDVASFIADCVRDQRGGDFPIGGPDIFSFCEIGLLAARIIGNEHELTIRKVPIFLLRVMAFVLSLVGHIWEPARRQAALLHWMVYVSTHDAVAPRIGNHRLRDEYNDKLKSAGRQFNNTSDFSQQRSTQG